MEIRPYCPDDDEQLMNIERQSARGFPHPFVHFRRRFIDRAELYHCHQTLVAEVDGQVVGVSSIIVKDTVIGGHACKVAYSFDSRILPQFRRQGIGHALVEEKLAWAKDQGAIGAYSLIVSTNQASLGMVGKSGYEKIRMVIYLKFSPYPLLEMPPTMPVCSPLPPEDDFIQNQFQDRNLHVPDIPQRVNHLDFCRWDIYPDDGGYAGLSVFDQAKIYTKISADAPWPRTEADIDRLGKNWHLFDIIGTEGDPSALYSIFQYLRDEAVVQNVNHIAWLADRAEPIPAFIWDIIDQQTDYWLMYKPFYDDAIPDWSGLVYLDPRDL